DLPTHIVLYKNFPSIRSVVHTHSKYAVAWAQSKRSIPSYGTTHADAFYGKIPCTRSLTAKEIETPYEQETGKVSVQSSCPMSIDPSAVPGVLVQNHGPFAWGRDINESVENSITLEEVAQIAMNTELLSPSAPEISNDLLDKHYL